jgi:hypothetical protein
LAVQRQEVAELADQDMYQQRFGCHAAIDWPLRRRCLHDGLPAGTAPVARTADDFRPQLRGHDVQHLRAGLADQMQSAATARALSAVDVDHHLVAWQMRRQRSEIAARADVTAASPRFL